MWTSTQQNDAQAWINLSLSLSLSLSFSLHPSPPHTHSLTHIKQLNGLFGVKDIIVLSVEVLEKKETF